MVTFAAVGVVYDSSAVAWLSLGLRKRRVAPFQFRCQKEASPGLRRLDEIPAKPRSTIETGQSACGKDTRRVNGPQLLALPFGTIYHSIVSKHRFCGAQVRHIEVLAHR